MPVARIIIASAAEASRAQLSRLLASSGIEVYRLCASGGELRRAMDECEDGVVVVAGVLPDCRPDDLIWDFESCYQILLIGRPEVLSSCESPDIFRLALPSSGSVILGAVEMLSQLHGMRLPKRTGEDKALVDEAKRLLMREQGISEPEAHRQMQKYAMRQSIKMTEYAAQLLQGRNDHA